MGELPQRHAARGMTMKALTLTGQKGDSFQDVQPVEHWLFFGGCLMIEGRLFHAWLNECLISCWPIVCSLGMARPHPVNFADAISWSFSLAVEWMVGSFGSLLASPIWYSWVCSHPQRTFRTSSSRAIFAACQGCMFVYHMRGSLYACDADDMYVRRSRSPMRLTA